MTDNQTHTLDTELWSATEIADRLDVGKTTLKSWAEKLGITRKNSRGEWVFNQEEVRLLEITKALRDEGRGLDTIVRRVGGQLPDDSQGSDTPAQPQADGGQAPVNQMLLAQNRQYIAFFEQRIEVLEDGFREAITEAATYKAKCDSLERELAELKAKQEGGWIGRIFGK